MTDDEIITLLRRGDPVARIVRMGPTIYRVRKLQTTWAPETRKPAHRPAGVTVRRPVRGHRLTLRVPDGWDWVSVSRETDADGKVTSIKVEVSE